MKKVSVFPLLSSITLVQCVASLCFAQTIVPANTQGITANSANGIDRVSVDFNQSQITLTKQVDGSYVLVTPNGTLRLYDFEHIYFKDVVVDLDKPLTNRTLHDPPSITDNTVIEHWDRTLFVYYGGNDLYSAGGDIDALSVDFNQSQTTLTKQTDGSYRLVTPNGAISFYDFEQLYFRDAAVALNDIDNDGILDIYETNTGVYISPTNTGTDPTNADTDGDGLLDGVETATGVYISPPDTGTNPNIADTDEDGLKDGAESLLKSLGFDPNINNSESIISLFENPNNAFLYTKSQFNGNRGAGQSDVTSNPGSYGLYTADSIMDLRMDGLMLQKQGSNAIVTFQPQTTTDLVTQPFTNNGTPITHEVPMPGNKGFLRIQANPTPAPPQ